MELVNQTTTTAIYSAELVACCGVKRKRSASLCEEDDDSDDRSSSSSSSTSSNAEVRELSVELQRWLYDVAVLKLKTALPLTRSLRRREQPLLRTLLLFNTLRSIEKQRLLSDAQFCRRDGEIDRLQEAAAADSSCVPPSPSASLLRPLVDSHHNVEVDELPAQSPTEARVTSSKCQVHGAGAGSSVVGLQKTYRSEMVPSSTCVDETSPKPSVDSLLSPDQLADSSYLRCSCLPNSTALDNNSFHLSSQSSADSKDLLFSSVDEELPVLTFSSCVELDMWPPLSSSALTDRRNPVPMAAAAAAAAAAPVQNIVPPIASTSHSDFDWADLTINDEAQHLSESSAITLLSSMDFDVDFEVLNSFESMTAPMSTLVSSPSPAASTVNSTTCNHRNELLSDELEHIVQQILVGTT